jgi:hypothetical protein
VRPQTAFQTQRISILQFNPRSRHELDVPKPRSKPDRKHILRFNPPRRHELKKPNPEANLTASNAVDG